MDIAILVLEMNIMILLLGDRDTRFNKTGEGGTPIKMPCLCTHTHDVLSLFVKIGGLHTHTHTPPPPKKRPPPPAHWISPRGSAPKWLETCIYNQYRFTYRKHK